MFVFKLIFLAFANFQTKLIAINGATTVGVAAAAAAAAAALILPFPLLSLLMHY